MKDARQNIIVLGAGGRMGRVITGLVEKSDNFRLAGAVDQAGVINHDLSCPVSSTLQDALALAPDSTIIDFTAPQASITAAHTASENKNPIVIGTTGLDESQKEELAEIAKSSPVLWSANMSVGVNVLARFLPLLAKALGPDYDMEMMEIHHKHKKDAPSGTALLLGDVLARARGQRIQEARCSCRDGIIGERPDGQIGIQALRGGDVVGIHSIYFFGPGEFVQVTHQAESRENFARGALRAAAWLATKKPGELYSMQDVISGE